MRWVLHEEGDLKEGEEEEELFIGRVCQCHFEIMFCLSTFEWQRCIHADPAVRYNTATSLAERVQETKCNITRT